MKKNDAETKPLGERVHKAFKEVGETFVHLAKAPRALWGINVSYFLEGLAYFGVLTILGKYLSEDVGLADQHAGLVYSLFTGGITAAMLLLGGVADRIGVRRAMVLALLIMVLGRTLLALSGTLFDYGGGAGSMMFVTLLAGLFVIVVGYGMYQPAAYAGVKEFTNKKTAAIGYAMIYALMNLGAFVSGFLSPPVRHRYGMVGVFWVFAVVTVLAFLAVAFILTRRTAQLARERVKREGDGFEQEEASEGSGGSAEKAEEPEGEKKAADEPKAARRSLREPLVVGLLVVLVLGVGGVIYRTVTAQASLQEKIAADFVTELGAAAELATSPLVEIPTFADEPSGDSTGAEPEKPAPTLRERLAELEARLAPPPAAEGVAVDPSALLVLQRHVANVRQLVEAFETDPATRTVDDIPMAKAREARVALRSHAVRLMALAYGLVSDVNIDVIQELRRRLKQPDEDEPIPLAESVVTEILRDAKLPPSELLAAFAAASEETASSLTARLPGRTGAMLARLLRSDAAVARDIAEKTRGSLGDVGRKAVTERMIVDSLVALAQAEHLVSFEPEVVGGPLDVLEFVIEKLPRIQEGVKPSHPGAYAALRFSATAEALGEEGGLLESLTGAVVPSFGQRLSAWFLASGMFMVLVGLALVFLVWRLLRLRPEHPFHNGPFTFFIFILIPVQTLFAHNWLTLPYYINRAFAGTTVGDNFEFFSNLNPILIFVLTPLVAALTVRVNVYKMMIWGTLVMAAPTFLLALPPGAALLMIYIVLMSIGEAMWQPRFLQLVAEIAPEGKTGAYMGIAQLPWFLTKVVTGLYSGWFIGTYCPRIGPQNNELMWLIYGAIAMISPVTLWLSKGWIGNKVTVKHK